MIGFAEFRMTQTVFYGRDSLTQLAEQASSLGKRALLISDRVMEKIGNVKRCEEYLNTTGVSFVSYLDVNSEPTDIHVTEALDICLQNECDLIIAVGGGSCIDAAKAVSVVAANG